MIPYDWCHYSVSHHVITNCSATQTHPPFLHIHYAWKVHGTFCATRMAEVHDFLFWHANTHGSASRGGVEVHGHMTTTPTL
jgi:hypothetical protein